MNRTRRAATVLHRWTGLALAGFLTITGLTGAALVWNDEGERLFAPALFTLPPVAHGPALDPFALRDAAARATPGYAINAVDFTRPPDRPALFAVEARPGGPAPPVDQIALDPATGRVLGARLTSEVRAVNTMPILDALHERLALGDTGALVLGVVALAWTIDCFVGMYLTFPARGGPGLLGRWGPAWRVRLGRGRYKLLYDLHRAGGLWPWVLLLVIAWSSVSFNLPQVYRPVTAALFGMAPDPPPPRAADPAVPPRLGWRAAHRLAQAAMTNRAAQEGFRIWSERLLFYDPASHLYQYRVLSDLDPAAPGNTTLFLDGDRGRVTATYLPAGRVAGTSLTTWIEDIHTAGVFGLPMRIAITLTGLVTASLSITGAWLWWRKRRAAGRRSGPATRSGGVAG